jgi:predicted MPP superfamily phosphohydrolase
MSLRDQLRFLVGLSRGLARGDGLPAAGRQRPAAAPGGTVPPPPPPAGNQATAFALAEHHLPLVGLAAPLRLLQLSDVHVRGPGRWLDRLLAFTRTLPEADLLVLTGDLVTKSWTADSWRAFARALPRARLGTFAIRGNWEHWCGAGGPDWEALLAEDGVQLLHNRAVEVGGLELLGLDDALAGAADWALLDRPAALPRVVLSHCPDTFPRIAARGAPLVLAGHSHAGQVRLPLIGAPWLPKGTGSWAAGWYSAGESQLFVSAGLGWSIAPVRVSCPPTADLLHLWPLPAAP